MLIKNRPEPIIVAPGPRPVAAPQPIVAASQFNGIFMRPNLSNSGMVPASSPFCTSPDIWVAGTTPVANFQTALATPASYQVESSDNVVEGTSNYIYVRGQNGGSTNQTNTVQLYYAPNASIQWPGSWENNVISTDQGNPMANITNLAPGQIGVADQTFLWPEVPAPPSGSDHYCLIAQLNDAGNSNPLPQISSQLDMAALVMTNFGFGWRNLTMVSGTQVSYQYPTLLTIPTNISPGSTQYFVFLNPTGLTGWSAAFQCSETDSNGNQIAIPQTPITKDGQIMGITCYLEPGFNATVTVSMWSNGNGSTKANLPLTVGYMAPPSEFLEAIERGLVDWSLTRLVQRARNVSQITPTVLVPLGADSAGISATTSLIDKPRN